MLVLKVKTASGRQFLREHDGNPQAVFFALHKHEKTSMHAEHTSQELMNRVKALDLSKWSGTYVEFLQNWSTQMFNLCELLHQQEDEPKEKTKKVMLRDAVAKVTVMAAVTTQESIQVASGQVAWTYNIYYDLLMIAAVADDHAKFRVTKAARTTNMHQQGGRGRDQRGEGRGRARGARGGRPSRDGRQARGRDGHRDGRGRGRQTDDSRVPYEVWKILPDSVKEVLNSQKSHRMVQAAVQSAYGRVSIPDGMWRQLPPAAQKAITDYNSRMPPSTPPHQRAAHQHTINPFDSYQEPIGQAAPPHPTPTQPTPPPNQSFVSQMISTDQGPAEERLIHKGHTYYRMNTLTTSYRVSEHKERTIANSLIDGGANGGFGGTDVRVIKYTDMYADVTGIDGHAVKNIPIATVAGRV